MAQFHDYQRWRDKSFWEANCQLGWIGQSTSRVQVRRIKKSNLKAWIPISLHNFPEGTKHALGTRWLYWIL